LSGPSTPRGFEGGGVQERDSRVGFRGEVGVSSLGIRLQLVREIPQ
jgi:hypothetical protein